MNKKSHVSYSGIGFPGLLTILLIYLKLTSVIVWSWWWILSPLWIPLAICLLFFLIFFIITFIVILLKK